MSDAEVTLAPVQLWTGHASIYRDPDGSLVLVYQADGSEEKHEKRVSAMQVSLAERLGSMFGNEEGLMKFLGGLVRRG